MKHSPQFFWLSASALVLPIVVAGAGCGGGGSNGSSARATATPFTPLPPITLPPGPRTTPIPENTPAFRFTPIPQNTPTTTNTPVPGAPLTSTGTYSPNLVFPEVNLSTRVENFSTLNDTLVLAGAGAGSVINVVIVPATNGTVTAGQTYKVVPDTSSTGGPSVTPNSAEVRYIATPNDPLSRATWRGASGTVTVVRFTPGFVAAGRSGELSVRLNSVKMVPTSINPATGTFVLNGSLTANSGGTQ